MSQTCFDVGGVGLLYKDEKYKGPLCYPFERNFSRANATSIIRMFAKRLACLSKEAPSPSPSADSPPRTQSTATLTFLRRL